MQHFRFLLELIFELLGALLVAVSLVGDLIGALSEKGKNRTLGQLQRPYSPELARAGLKVTKQSGHKGSCKPKMTGSEFESVKKLLARGVPPNHVAKALGRCTAGRRRQRMLSVRFFPFSERAPTGVSNST
ncbi:hypothetical protein HH1059_20380 [Halorhodospira halochloris]|uniref:Mobile element protein n=1 Tax=Halorhodospira halochloris TaxID=1052 RepID=A0A2Z6EZY3_HALHR|nr:hypothetical protein [Halorhodospira halochloris]MBK1651911.1 hypothetical protein [Halorhodospira halochloris]BBE11153.1 hypothetical protein HH1059_20380 [Halorhodospira halochloris]